MASITIYTDGGSRNNPGEAGAGAVIYNDGKRVAEISKYLGIQTNNWAEYEAAALALKEAARLGFSGQKVEMKLDSQLVVRQLLGEYKIKVETLKPQHAKVRSLLDEHFPKAILTYIPRAQNKEADRLANEAMDRKKN